MILVSIKLKGLLEKNQDKKVLYILPLVLVSLFFIMGIPSLDMASKNYSNIFLNILWAISMIYTLILLFKKVNYSNKLLTIWGGQYYVAFYHSSLYK